MKRKLPDITNILEKTEKKNSRTGLTPFQTRFVEEWVKSMNNRTAYLEAGGEGCETETQLQNKATKIKNNKLVLFAIDKKLKELTKKVNLKKEEVLSELMRIGFSDPRQFFKEDGSLKSMDELTVAEASAIKSITVVEIYEGQGEERHFIGYEKKIQFNDKLKALELLCKNLGILKEVGDTNILNQIQLNLKVEEAKKLGLPKLLKLNDILN
ncbi:MAG: terminase small subunit [Flavobacteriales bacterium]|jgi:phage terminase small subunit|nr:terminase small subunit [Flavobacteriales bacterium]|tara:strand:- start:14718 stop:15353 length:636 start_codon:yes stop_codon:yes gene_type:complete